MVRGKVFSSQKPVLDLSEGPEMLKDFTRESQRHLISARNALLVLDNFSSDKEAIESLFKTFRTISGFAEFLQLHDICALSRAVDSLIERVRKEKKLFKRGPRIVIQKSIERLQELLELLDEQIDNGGKAPKEYPDISDDMVLLTGPLSKICRDSADIQDRALSESIEDINLKVISRLKEVIEKNQELISIDRRTLKNVYLQFEEVWKKLCNARKELENRRVELIQERELAIRLTDKAQAEARAKSDHLAHISHEIRTLINAILGFADVVRNRLPKDSPEQAHIQTILLSGKMLLEIVNTVLDYAKVEAGRLTLESVEFSIANVVEEVFQIIRTRVDQKSVNLYANISPELPQSVVGDPTRLKQVLLNLLDNALKFTDKGEVGLTAGLDADQGSDAAVVVSFEIADTGVGIPEERAQDVFESYTQAESSTARRYGGTGLGLSLCRLFIDAMKGTISLESELGSGTVFHFSIPFAKGKAIEDVDPWQTDKTIGLISAFSSTRESFKNVCEGSHITNFGIFQNVKQAMEHFEKKGKCPDAIIVDTLLGKEASAFIRRMQEQETFAAVKVVALTNDVRFGELKPAWKDYADAVIFSPIMKNELRTCIEKFFSHQEPSDAQDSLDERVEGSSVKVLVVEDSVPNQELLKLYFHDLNCECRIAGNGQQALDILSQEAFDICFMDLQMPVLGGMDAARRIRSELQLDLPIIALTAAQVDEEREACLKNGMSDYLAKPFSIDQLNDMLSQYVTTENTHE